jgi:hypothetical protein
MIHSLRPSPRFPRRLVLTELMEGACMAVIDADAPCLTAVTSLDLPEQHVGTTLSQLVASCEDRARLAPGFVSASILRRRPAEPDSSAPRRLLEYSQWDSPSAYQRFAFSAVAVSDDATPSHTDIYTLDAVISPARRLEIAAPDPRLTLVVSMRAHAGKQAFINDYNQDETRDYFSKFDGFVGVAFHLGADGLVLEYLQWESSDALHAATSTERFEVHMANNAQQCQSIDFGAYEVIYTIPAKHRG